MSLLPHAIRPRKRTRSLRRTVAKQGIIAGALGASVYLAVCAYAAGRLSVATRVALVSTPADYGLPYESVQFPSAVDGVALKGWLVGAGTGKTILMLHAKDGKRDDPTIGLLDIAKALVQHGYSVFAFDFRGHGESGGTRFGLGTLETRDVAGALRYLKTRGIGEVGTLGFSLGAVTALNSAPGHPEMRAVVADSSFADVLPLLDDDLPKATSLPEFFAPGLVFMSRVLYGIDLANDKPARAVARLGNRPLLLIHGAADIYVPVGDAYVLQRAGAPNPNLRLWIVPGAEHVRAFKQFPQEYLSRVIGFFDEYL